MNVTPHTICSASYPACKPWQIVCLTCGLALMASCQRGGSNVNAPARPNSPQATSDTATHVLKTDVVYYLGGPQQGAPPDGTLQAGTRVTLVRDEGSYSRVRTADGVECSIEKGALEELAN